MDYRYGRHTVYQIGYHFVWVTKYRYKVLSGELAASFLGEGIFLRDSRADDGRDDQTIFGTSL